MSQDSKRVIEPFLDYIHELATHDATTIKEGPLTAMGVPRYDLPLWDDLQLLPAQLAKRPVDGKDAEGKPANPVDTKLVIGPAAARPLEVSVPLIVSDMSFGALSKQAKLALAKGAKLARTAMCTGEGGFSPLELEELRAHPDDKTQYLFELGSGEFGFAKLDYDDIRAFHFKAGQAAKTGIGGHLPGDKVTQEIVDARGPDKYKVGESIISPATFRELQTVDDFRRVADEVRAKTGGVPIGFKLSANHIEADMGFALDAGADYIILDGRGGSTGASPALFRNHISVPTIPALARARRFLDERGATGRVTLIATGGLRTPTDFVKALALGADGVALSNSALQAIGCIAARRCDKGDCPAGIATQREDLAYKLEVDQAARRLANFFSSCGALMSELTRACGYMRLADLSRDDLTTWRWEMAQLSGVRFSGVGSAD